MAQYAFVDKEYGKGQYLMVKDAKLKYKNFSGRATQLNPEGAKRYVNLVVDSPNLFEKMLEDGWNFRTDSRTPGEKDWAEPFEELPDGRVAFPYTELKIQYHHDPEREFMDPKIYISKGGEPLDLYEEPGIGVVDNAKILKANLQINPSVWNVGGNSGVKGYINMAEIFIENPNPFDAAFDNFDDEEEPFV